MFFLFLHKDIRCWYSLEAPQALLMSTNNICFEVLLNEYQQNMFSWRNKKNISTFRFKDAPCLTPFIMASRICALSPVEYVPYDHSDVTSRRLTI